jgi:hypothetical protein
MDKVGMTTDAYHGSQASYVTHAPHGLAHAPYLRVAPCGQPR